MTSTHKSRAQSAMEYLMTYGWAILIIAVVLAALFAIGVFNGSNVTSSVCIAAPGFLCSGAVYSHSTANIVATIGQSSGTNWITANVVFVPSGVPLSEGVPMISFDSLPANTYLTTSQLGLYNGGEALLYLPVNSVAQPVPVGTVVVGAIWASYSYYTTSQGIQQTNTGYAQIATLTLKAS